MSNLIKAIFIAVLFIVGTTNGFAQSKTEGTPETIVADYITYQGRMLNAGVPANGNYDFQFTITTSGGSVIESTQVLGVPVTNGIFTARFLVNISTFASNPGAYMSVGVRQLPTDPYTPLAPRQPISSTPVAFKAHEASNALFASNSAQLGGVNASQYVLTDDPRLNDTREPAPGSANYIQNGTSLQTASFNISGIGNAEAFNAHSSFSLDGFIVLAAPGNGNIFGGSGAGSSNTTGSDNAIFGRDAGFNNLTGSGNSFFGSGAGKYTTVDGNSFFGKHAGYLNTTGAWNTFLGYEAGFSNVIGGGNVFVGYKAGRLNTADDNTFVGLNAGASNTTGNDNAFVGSQNGQSNTTGYNNSFLGSGAGSSNSTGYNNTFVGTVAGSGNSFGFDNVFVGRSAGLHNVTGTGNVFVGARAGFGANGVPNASGINNIAIGADTLVVDGITNSVVIGRGATVSQSNQIVLGKSSQDTLVSGQLKIGTIPAGGVLQLCASAGIISSCGSSIRFKEKVEGFYSGLDLIKRLRPVSFTWKSDGTRDVGFIAEEVAEVEPLLANRDEKGEVQGVKYDRISTALVNAVNQQQSQIDSLQTLVSDQQKQIQKQQEQIELLKRVVCETNATAAVCKEKE